MFQTRSGAGFFLDLHGGAVALRKMIQDMASLKHSSILYLVYVLLSAAASSLHFNRYLTTGVIWCKVQE